MSREKHHNERNEEFKCWKSHGNASQDTYLVAGVDEAGRGPWAGPLVVAACMVPLDFEITEDASSSEKIHILDSKALTHAQRERAFECLTSDSRVKYSVQILSHDEVDDLNILEATMTGMTRAVNALNPQPKYVLIDGPRVPKGLQARLNAEESKDMDALPSLHGIKPIIRGDSTEFAIAAASILAKVTRDRLMDELEKKHPGYGFGQHKGYGVPAHRDALQKLGPCPVHRKSFNPVKTMIGWVRPGSENTSSKSKSTRPRPQRTTVVEDDHDGTESKQIDDLREEIQTARTSDHAAEVETPRSRRMTRRAALREIQESNSMTTTSSSRPEDDSVQPQRGRRRATNPQSENTTDGVQKTKRVNRSFNPP